MLEPFCFLKSCLYKLVKRLQHFTAILSEPLFNLPKPSFDSLLVKIQFNVTFLCSCETLSHHKLFSWKSNNLNLRQSLAQVSSHSNIHQVPLLYQAWFYSRDILNKTDLATVLTELPVVAKLTRTEVYCCEGRNKVCWGTLRRNTYPREELPR